MIVSTTRLRLVVAAILMLGTIALVVACSSGDDNDPGVGAVITVINSPSVGLTPVSEIPTETAVPAGPTATLPPGATPAPTATTAAANDTDYLTGYIYPIAGGCLPDGDQLMPNAPRTYRNGTHEGVDFYNVDNCTTIGLGTPVMAARDGVVIRVDSDYTDPTPAQMEAYLANPTADSSFDAFRGRQVWVRHDDGGVYVTRYCHLSAIAQGITVGTRVTAGQTIAYVGESGTPESLTNPGSELHLHFEMRIGNSYLGDGQSPAQVRALYLELFSE